MLTDEVFVLSPQKSTSPCCPNFTTQIFESLPKVLLKGVSLFSLPHEQSFFLLGALSCLSGLLPIIGLHDGDIVYPNIYTFIIAHSASGKGVLKYADLLVRGIYEKFDLKPIPGNVSEPGLFQLLALNNGGGHFFIPEADALSTSLKRSIGDFSYMLRQGFQNEDLQRYRSGQELINISNVRLGLLISGTKGQLFNLIPDAENGLFSRFCYFWADMSNGIKRADNKGVSIAEQIVPLSNEILSIYIKMMNTSNKPVTFCFTHEQADKCYDIMSAYDKEVNKQYGNDGKAVIRRMYLICRRIAMVLTALRIGESNKCEKEIVCSSIDCENALNIVSTLLHHSFWVYENLPKKELNSSYNTGHPIATILNKMEEVFKRDDLVKACNGIVEPATVTRFLRKSSLVEKANKYGYYKKSRAINREDEGKIQ